jgi:uncharacterized protein (DUF433 family)
MVRRRTCRRHRSHCRPRLRATSYRYLTNIPGLRSGRTIIKGTRIGVHDVVAFIILGSSVDEVCRSFPGVTRACLAHYEDRRGEIDALVAEQIAPEGQ